MLVYVPRKEIHWMEPRDIQEAELHRLLQNSVTALGVSAAGQYGMVQVVDGVLSISD